ncbi:MAG: FAD-dependent oxidoreductase, partial [Verrucomicrobiales bacterium]|nr:FAD-dependent oxidoreductase [Verrucomicrobiales bacterium]
TKSWRVDEFLPLATGFYKGVQKAAGARVWHEKKTVRVLKSEDEMMAWGEKRRDAGFAGYLSQPWIVPGGVSDGVNAGWGAFEMTGGGYVDLPVFLDVVRKVLGEDYRAGEVRCEDVDVTGSGVTWGGIKAKYLVFCQGFEGAKNRYFDWVPFRSAKGEVLEVAIDGYGDGRVINSGGWLLPLADGRFRAGSTYSWDPLDSVVTKAGRQRIVKNLRRLLVPEIAVVDQRAAVRPIINASKVLMGLHPTHGRIGFFNGLGSKGVLNGPYFAQQLAAHLVEGAPIEEEADLRKNG